MSKGYFDIEAYDKLVSCGGFTTTVTTSGNVAKVSDVKSFSFKTTRINNIDIIVSIEEWEKFLEFVGVTESRVLCKQD